MFFFFKGRFGFNTLEMIKIRSSVKCLVLSKGNKNPYMEFFYFNEGAKLDTEDFKIHFLLP